MNTIYAIRYTKSFKKDLKKATRQGLNLTLLYETVNKLASGKKLPETQRDHALTGNIKGFRECHIQPDWLLVYRINNQVMTLTLVSTGSHSHIF